MNFLKYVPKCEAPSSTAWPSDDKTDFTNASGTYNDTISNSHEIIH